MIYIDLIDFLKSINGLMDEANFFSYQPVGLEREENSWKIFARTSSSKVSQPEFLGLEISSRTFM